jgi:hypothetical protein
MLKLQSNTVLVSIPDVITSDVNIVEVGSVMIGVTDSGEVSVMLVVADAVIAVDCDVTGVSVVLETTDVSLVCVVE